MPDLIGLSHVALTVTDLERSARWYERVFGLERAETVTDLHEAGHDLVVLIHPDTDMAINLHRHPGNDSSRFDERRTGLDHVSFLVRGRDDLEHWASHLDRLDVSHGMIAEEDYGSVLVLRDPDNIQLELFANPT